MSVDWFLDIDESIRRREKPFPCSNYSGSVDARIDSDIRDEVAFDDVLPLDEKEGKYAWSFQALRN